jgi:DNA repair exonuclease SbcCD ATPase subunit
MLESLKERVNKLSYEIKANKSVLDKTRTDLKLCEDRAQLLNLASEVLKRIGDQKKQQTIIIFEKVVTAAISEVFGFNYVFKIDIDSEGKRVSTKFKLIDSSGNEISIMDGVGGGLIDVVSFVLRVLILASAKPKRMQALFLDESFKHLSEAYRPKVATLLKSLSKRLGMQFLLVTHQSELLEAADVAYQLEKTPEGTIARKL